MNAFFLILLILAPQISLFAQSPLDQLSILPAQSMVDAFNAKNYQRYVDYLMPSQYENDPSKKEGLAKSFETGWKSDTSLLRIKKVLSTSDQSGIRQILFQATLHQRMGYIIGKSTDGGMQWLYSQFIGYGAHFDFILKMLPDIDTKFSDIIDPKFNKRIKYVEGITAPGFNYTDVNENVWSSSDLLGKIVVLYFWSVNYKSCVDPIPQLNKLVESVGPKDVVFIAPAFYSPQEMMIRNFLPDHPFLYHVSEITEADDYSIEAFPTHIVIDKSGKVALKLLGASEETLKSLSEGIKKLVLQK